MRKYIVFEIDNINNHRVYEGDYPGLQTQDGESHIEIQSDLSNEDTDRIIELIEASLNTTQ
jgi:hypothetical protein